MTILVHEWVTGGGPAGSPLPASWAAEGGAMRRAIASDFANLPGVRVVMTLDERLPDEPGPWSVARVGDGEEAGRFAQLATEAHFTALIAPEAEGILADRARVLEQVGARSLGSTPEAIETAGNKLRMGMLLDRLGIDTPECRRIEQGEALPDDFRYPAVLKPVDGAGSIDTFWIPGPATVPEEARAIPNALLQPFIRGTPMSASFLVGTSGARLLGVGQQRMTIRDGRFVYQGGTLPAPSDRVDRSVRLAAESVPGLRGFVGVDFVWDEESRRAIVLEVNPRPTTSYVGLARLLPEGVLARSWIDAVTGRHNPEEREISEVVHSQVPLTFLADGTIRRGDG